MLIMETARKIVLDILPTVRGEYSNSEQTLQVRNFWKTSTAMEIYTKLD